MTPRPGSGLKRNRYAMQDFDRSFGKLRMTKSPLRCIKTIDTTLSFRAQARNLFKKLAKRLSNDHAHRIWFSWSNERTTI